MAAMQQSLIVIQDGASLIRKLRAPKTAAEVLNALQLNGHIFDGDGVQLVGSDSLEAGNYTFKQIDVPSTPAAGYSYQPPVLPGTDKQLVFWKRLASAVEKPSEVLIKDADMEADMKVIILELQENSTFMGAEKAGISRIMVPKFYEDLWKIAEQLIHKGGGMVITGTPGTGKSVMGWYFIYKLRKTLGSFNLVYQDHASGLQTLYSKDGTVTWSSTASDSFRQLLASSDTVYVVDGAGVLSRAALTFVFASPDRKFLKKAGIGLYHSKVWSKTEILAAHQLLFKGINESLILELYTKWGGVPRHVLERAEDSYWQANLDRKIQSVTGKGWLNFMTNLGNVGSPEITDIVMHRTTEDYVKTTANLASFYVSELALSKMRTTAWAEIVQFLKTDDSASASYRGQLFETAAHNVLARKCSVRVRSLEGHGRTEIENLRWPQLKHRKFRKLSHGQDLEAEDLGCYWQPESKTNPAFDAVCSNIGAPLGTTAALQMTISKDHGIKHDGLVKLVEAVPSVKRLYFVVPDSIFEDFPKQTLRNKDSSSRSQATLDSVSRVEQWALELPLDYICAGPVQSKREGKRTVQSKRARG